MCMLCILVDLCVVQFRQRYCVVLDKVFNLAVKRVEDRWVGGNNGGLVAITACQVLRGDYCDRHFVGAYQNNLAVVVCEVGVLDDLREKSP